MRDILIDPDIVRRKGRPSRTDRRLELIAFYGEFKVGRMDAEIGKPVEELPKDEFEKFYRALAMEKGWPI